MLNFYVLSFCLFSNVALADTSPFTVDHKDPISVTEAIFEAARSNSVQHLSGLCDPLKKNDGDTQRICDAKKNDSKWSEYIFYFQDGRTIGPAKISGNRAKVDIKMGKDGTLKEEMNLVMREGKWYLSDF